MLSSEAVVLPPLLYHASCVLAATFGDTVLAVQDAVAALQKALTFGLQYGPMADVAVTALERWERSQPQVRDLHLFCYLSARTQLSMLRISSVPSSSLERYCCAEPSLVKYAGTAAAGATSAAAVGPIPPGGLGHRTGSSD